MNIIIGGKNYDRKDCKIICKTGCGNNGNYSGTEHLVRADDGNLFIWANNFYPIELYDAEAFIEQKEFSDIELEDLRKIGLVKHQSPAVQG